jgi:hypothetical protein
MTNYTFDGYAQQRRDETAQEPAQTDTRGFGTFAGMIAILGGIVFLVPSGGLSAFLILAGCAGMAGDKVHQKASAEIEQAVVARDVAAVDRAFLGGCTKIVLIGALTFLIIAVLAAGLTGGL